MSMLQPLWDGKGAGMAARSHKDGPDSIYLKLLQTQERVGSKIQPFVRLEQGSLIQDLDAKTRETRCVEKSLLAP